MKTLDEPIEAFGAMIDEVVDTVTWTGGPINPGEFDEFYISAPRFRMSPANSSSRPNRPTTTAKS